MAYLGNTFDPTAIPEDDRSFEPMPAGDYNVQIIESEIVQTKSGGDMLKLTLEVIDGPYENRKVWDNLNIRNANPQAQSIAHRALADICAAVGVGAIQDSEDLHFKPLVAALKIETDKSGQYDPRNGVKRYKTRGGQPPEGKAATGQRPAARPAAAQSGRGAATPRPWSNGGRSAPARAEMDDTIPF